MTDRADEESLAGAGREGEGPVLSFRSDPGPVSLVRALELFRTAGLAPDTAFFSLDENGAGSQAQIAFAAGTDAGRFGIVVRKVSQLPGVHEVSVPSPGTRRTREAQEVIPDV